MSLLKVWFKDFRNFENKLIDFSDELTVIVGPNASGKTNILEGINLLSNGRSFKARREEEMVNYDSDIARVKGKLSDEQTLEVVLTRGQVSRGEVTKRTARKRLLVSDVGKRLIDFSENFNVVVFRPQDMDLVTDSPSYRRKFLDSVLNQTDRQYRKYLIEYEKAVTRRNKILYRIREEGIERSNLYFWDKLLIKNGQYVTEKRAEFIHSVNKTDSLGGKEFELEYDKSVISEDRIEQYARAEVASATTLVGPHRDDVIFKIEIDGKMRELDKYGSRGEQRMAVLWVKMAELEYVKQNSSENMTLLLDDIFSELDHEHREIVMDLVKGQQTVMTTADPHFLEGIGDFEKIELE